MRIVTRPDFDGVVCAVLLFEAESVDHPVKWVQPGDLQKGLVEIQTGDILANLPYDPRCSLWFDHHYTNRVEHGFDGLFDIAPSAAGLVHHYYAGRFRRDYRELVQAADKVDAADLTLAEVLNPETNPYVLLSMTITDQDPGEEAYWNRLCGLLREHGIQRVLDDPQVQQKCRQVMERSQAYADAVRHHTQLMDQVTVTDFRPLGAAPEGNRFLVYAMYPDAVAAVKIRYESEDPGSIRVSVGHSIFNPNCRVNVGLLLSAFEGGGHRAAGGCSFSAVLADTYIPRIVDILRKNEPNEPKEAG